MALGGTLALTGFTITNITPENPGSTATTFRVTMAQAGNVSFLVLPGITQAQISVAETAMNTQASITCTLT